MASRHEISYIYGVVFKDGVRIPLGPQGIVLAAIVASEVYTEFGYDFVITSWNDGVHMAGSKHYKNEAFDCRTKHILLPDKTPDAATCKRIRDEIDRRLPDGFDVIFEGDHIHVESDLKTH
jgi:hypothetical protein